jgi:hypothetical protein
MARSNAGGGAGSRQSKQVPVQTGKAAKGAGVEASALIGIARGTHSTDHGDLIPKKIPLYPPNRTPAGGGQMLGNEKALLAKSIGQDRTIYKSGGQGTHGKVDQGQPRAVPDRGHPEKLIDSFGPSMPGAGRR